MLPLRDKGHTYAVAFLITAENDLSISGLEHS